MRHAARTTSAGPTFFNVTRRCVNGGLVANDPAFVAWTDAIHPMGATGQPANGLLLISLGTGTKGPGTTLRWTTSLRWSTPGRGGSS